MIIYRLPETFLSKTQGSGIMTLGGDLKRKSLEKPDEEGGRAQKIFKEASEYFHQDSTGDNEPAAENEVLVQKEVCTAQQKEKIKQRFKKIKQEPAIDNIEQCIESETPLPETPTSVITSEDADNSLINHLLISDEDSSEDEEDDCDYDISEDEADPGEDASKIQLTRSTAVNLKFQLTSGVVKLKEEIEKSLQLKDNIIKELKEENEKLRHHFTNQLKVKKEKMDDSLVQNKTDFDRQLSNVDEEREYLIEEIKYKDSELERKAAEIKMKDDSIKDISDKYQKLDKLKIELKRSLDDRDKVVKRLEETKVRLESKLTLALKKKFVRTDVELRLQEVEKELEAVREVKYKLEDENSKLEQQKSNLEKKMNDNLKNVHQNEELRVKFDQELKEQKASFEKEIKEKEKNMKSLRNELKDNDNVIKARTVRITDLETSLSNVERKLNEEISAKESLRIKLSKVEESETILTEYKIDLEARVRDLAFSEEGLKKQVTNLTEEQRNLTEENKSWKVKYEKRISEIEAESNKLIMEDLKLIEKSRVEMEEIKRQLAKIQTNFENSQNEKKLLEQEHISLQILTSEKDEVITERNLNIEKVRQKYQKLKSKMVELIQLNEGLDNRVTVTELKYFNLEKDLTDKAIVIQKLESDLIVAEKSLEEIRLTSEKNLEELRSTNNQVMEQLKKDKTELEETMKGLEQQLAMEKEKTVKEKADMQKTKKFLLDQIAQIKKRSNASINLNTQYETIDIN